MLMGAGLMYLLDRRQGRRRRALLRDAVRHQIHEVEHVLDQSTRDFRNRAQGALARTRSHKHEPADDSVVRERVRSALGRIVSHPSAIDVHVMDGRVVLHGPVLFPEHRRLVSRVRRVPGVIEVLDELDLYESGENVPSLQGGTRREPRFEYFQENWTPAARVLAGAVGGATALYGMRRGGVTGNAATWGGLALITRAVTNLPARRLVGASGRRAITINKSINIEAPVDEVYRFWSHFENFPRFMSHLHSVRKTDDGRSHWVAAGPAGSSLEWDAVTTEDVPNERISWKSAPSAAVRSAGTVRFLPQPDGNTRVDVRLSYSPPAGAIGHAIASLFGTDPKHAMDDDLVRLKSLLEQGRTSAEGETVTLDETRLP
jgi:uncharacterized membrane protein